MSSAATDEPVFLIVEDDERLAQSLKRVVNSIFRARVCETLEASLEALTGARMAGAIVDVGLPEGNSGIEFVRAWHRFGGNRNVLVVSGNPGQEVANDASASGALFAYKPAIDASLVRVLLDAVAESYLDDSRLRRRFAALCQDKNLTPHEGRIVALRASGLSRKQIADYCRISEDTLKSQIKILLAKCDAASLENVVERLKNAP